MPDLKLAKERARTRRLSVDEERLLWMAAGPHLRDCITAALDTGMRRGEILGLQWRDVRWENDEPNELVLRADATKTGTSRTIPLLPTMVALLKARRLDPNGDALPLTAHVFGNAVGEAVDGITVAWGGTCKRAGIDGLTFHDLRRSAASRYLEAGLPLSHVKELLGHVNISTTSRYLSVTSTELRASMGARRQPARLGPPLGRLAAPCPLPPTAGRCSAQRRPLPFLATPVFYLGQTQDAKNFGPAPRAASDLTNRTSALAMRRASA